MADLAMNTMPTDAWNTAFNDQNIKANMVFPTEPAWTQFVKTARKANKVAPSVKKTSSPKLLRVG